MAEELPDEPSDFERPPSFFPYEESEPEAEQPADYGEPVEVQVEAVLAMQTENEVQRFVLLTDGTRKLPIVIGGFEAAAIMTSLEGIQSERPMTHDLVRKILERLDVTVDRIVIDDLWGSTYYAKIYLRDDEFEIEIDSRPSDAIAIALRFEAPIFVADGILAQAMTEE